MVVDVGNVAVFFLFCEVVQALDLYDLLRVLPLVVAFLRLFHLRNWFRLLLDELLHVCPIFGRRSVGQGGSLHIAGHRWWLFDVGVAFVVEVGPGLEAIVVIVRRVQYLRVI